VALIPAGSFCTASADSARDEAVGVAYSMVELIARPGNYNKSIVAFINETVDIDQKFFNDQVYSGLSPSKIQDVSEILVRSNLFRYKISGDLWKVVRESSDQCVYLIDDTYYSTTNLTSNNHAFSIENLVGYYHNKYAFDPVARYGYKMGYYTPSLSSSLTASDSKCQEPMNLNLYNRIEHEMAFLFLAALQQTNLSSNPLCNSLLYDFDGLKPNRENIEKAYDEGKLHFLSLDGVSSGEVIIKPGPGFVVKFDFKEGLVAPFRRIEMIQNGKSVRVISRKPIHGQSWFFEWVDEVFDDNSKLLRYSRRYIISESEVNVLKLLEAFDADQKLADLSTHKASDGNYTDKHSGKVVGGRSGGKREFSVPKDVGRLGFVIVFGSISIGAGYLLVKSNRVGK
jgi:hypothetical protein